LTSIDVRRTHPVGDDGEHIADGVPSDVLARFGPQCMGRLVDLGSDWFWETDAEHRFSWFSVPASLRAVQNPGRNMGSQRWNLPGADHPANSWADHLAASDAHETYHDFEYITGSETLGWAWRSVSGVPFFDEAGKFLGYRGTARDITERKATKARARRVAQMYAALEGINQAVVNVADELGLAIAACDALYELGGFEMVNIRRMDASASVLAPIAARGIAVGDLANFHLPLDDDAAQVARRARAWGPGERAFQEGRTCYVPDYHVDPDLAASHERAREQGVASIVGVPLRCGARVWGVLSIASGVAHCFDDELLRLIEQVGSSLSYALDSLRASAERGDARARLAANEARYRHLTRLSTDWVWETDDQHRLVYMTQPQGNEVAPVAELGRARWEMPRVQGVANDWDAHRHALAAHEPFRDFHYAGRDDAGVIRWFSLNGDPVFDASGEFAGYLGTSADITARRNAEERAARLTRLYAALGTIHEAVSGNAGAAELHAATCEALHDIGGFTVSVVRMVDAAGEVLAPVASSGMDIKRLSTYRFPGGGTEAAQQEPGTSWSDPHPIAFREGRTCYVPDYLVDAELRASWGRAIEQGVAAVLAVPLRCGGKTCGVLSVAAREAHYFDDELRELVERAAAALSYALDGWATEAQRRAAQHQLAASEERFRRLNELSVDWIWERDAELRLTYLSPSYFELTGMRPEDVLGTGIAELHEVTDDEETRRTYFAAVIAHRPFRDYEYARRDPDGVLRWRSISGDPILDDAGGFKGYQGTGRNVTERRIHEEALRRQANFDALTGLPNRTLLRDRIQHAIGHAARSGRTVAVMLLDLDEFKQINDCLGHEAGDAVLRRIAGSLQRCVRPEDTVGRMAGDEFVVVLEELEAEAQIQEIATRLLADLATPRDVEGRIVSVSASIGVAIFPRDGDDAAILLRNADAAMYQAKAGGGGAVHFYTEALNARAARYVSVRADLHRALERGDFALHYQPIVGCGDGRVVGAEALLRWRRADETLALPEEFIDVAEDTGLIVRIGAWVLRSACAQAKAWQEAGHARLPVSVNVSARQFRHGDLVALVQDALSESGLAADLLTLELTESTMMSDLDAATATLAKIKELGVSVSIDDFGTGHSSLAYLKRFAVSELKIDRSFVRDAPTNPDDATIVRAVIDLAHALGLRVVAEGVETDEQAVLLRQFGCDRMQGFRLGRPMPAAAFVKLLGAARVEACAETRAFTLM